MRKLFFVLLLITGINAAAQNERAFFTRDSASMMNIAKLVMENAKNKYHFEKAIPQKRNSEFWYRNDSARTVLIRVLFKFLPDSSGWILTHVTGLSEDIFPFWKKYFDASAVLPEGRTARETKYITTRFLKGEARYYFGRINSQMCEIEGGYIPDPIKK